MASRTFKIVPANDHDKKMLEQLFANKTFFPEQTSTPALPATPNAVFDYRQFFIFMGTDRDGNLAVYTRDEINAVDFDQYIPDTDWTTRYYLSAIPTVSETFIDIYQSRSTIYFLSYEYPRPAITAATPGVFFTAIGYPAAANFPDIGSPNRIYIDLSTNIEYRWNSSNNTYAVYSNNGGGGGGATNLGLTQTTTQVTVTSDTGADVIIPSATTSLAGVMSAADKTALNNVVAIKPKKYIYFKFNGELPQNTVFERIQPSYLDKNYKLKKIIVCFDIFNMDISKTIPIEIYRESVNAVPSQSSDLVVAANCIESTTDLYGNRIFTFDVDILINSNQILEVVSGAFTAGTQLLLNCKVELILEEV